MRAGLIAAGLGERLVAGGITTPKPLVRIAGKALVDHVLDAAAAAGVDEVACLFNAEPETDAVEAHCRARPGAPRLRMARRTTPSSMESLFVVAGMLADAPAPVLVLTVDAIFAPPTLRAFLDAAGALTADVVLAVTTHVDDEKPLYVACTDDGRVTAIGAAATGSRFITAGFYVFRPRVFAEVAAARAAGCTALRAFLGHLHARGYRLAAAPIGTTFDVDRPQDIAAAEAFVRGGYAP